MKIVKAGFKILGECATNINDTLTEIEYAGRTAYQSHEKITKDSTIRFCKMIADRGHHSVLEHSNIVVAQNKIGYTENIEPVFQHDSFVNNKNQMPYHMIKSIGGVQYISGNIRAWLNCLNELEKTKPLALFRLIENYLSPINGAPIVQKEQISSNFRIVTDHEEIPLGMRRVMVEFTCPRSLSHQLVRHRRRIGITQESTRYIRYKELRIHRPSGLTTPFQQDLWYTSMIQAEKAYSLLLDNGCRAEIARAVLPLSTSTKLAITADIEEWRWILKLRCSPGADPAMRELMIPLKKEFEATGWI